MAKVLRSAVKARLLARNPCDDTELPTIEREEQRFLTPAEVATLADAIDQRYRPAVFVAAYGGLRAGELFGLAVAGSTCCAGRWTWPRPWWR
jgi:integrase